MCIVYFREDFFTVMIVISFGLSISAGGGLQICPAEIGIEMGVVMIKTYDFLLMAKRDKNFRSQIDKVISNGLNSEIFTDIHRLIFSSESQTVSITAKSNVSPSKDKIVPKKITYKALIKMLNGEWDSIEPNDITDL